VHLKLIKHLERNTIKTDLNSMGYFDLFTDAKGDVCTVLLAPAREI
jgi:hypothetical protein